MFTEDAPQASRGEDHKSYSRGEEGATGWPFTHYLTLIRPSKPATIIIVDLCVARRLTLCFQDNRVSLQSGFILLSVRENCITVDSVIATGGYFEHNV